MGTPDVDPPCGANTDTDCVPPLGSVGPSDGIGPGLVINANLIMGNAAESGSGGGLRLQHVNGSDVLSFPNGASAVTFPGLTGARSPWYSATVTNNIIVNNVAGWDGGGVSLLDALNVNIINNTIVSNDSTASAGVLFNTLGAPLASTQQTNCIQANGTSSCPQPAGLVSVQNSATLVANLPATVTCPAGHFAGTTAANGTCRTTSYPELYNDVLWQNRSFYIGVGSLGAGTLNQQHVVALQPALNQTATGQCVTGASYWDIGVRGDTGPADHTSTVTLAPEASILTSTAGYPGGGTGFQVNSASNPAVVSQYCNGSRVPPEFGGLGYQVPPGISDATVPNPIFNLTPAATVDEGNNWINISWGPLAMTNPATNVTLGNYALTAGSPAISYVTATNSATTYAAAPSLDFFNKARKGDGAVDVGAVEFAASTSVASATLAPTTRNFGTVTRTCPGTTFIQRLACALDPAQVFTLTNTGTVPLTGIAQATLGGANTNEFGIVRLASTCGPAGNGQLLGITTLAPGATCIVTVQFKPLTAQPTGVKNATVSVTDSAGTQTSTLTGTAR